MPHKDWPATETKALTFEREALIPQDTPRKMRTTLITKQQTLAPAKAKRLHGRAKPRRGK